MHQFDNTILDDIVLPSTINKQVLIDRILQDWGGYNCRFSNPDMCKRFVHSWFSANEYNFEMMQKALTMEYNPIENYDRWSGHTITHNENRTENVESKSKHELTNETESKNKISGKNTTENETKQNQSPFDSSTLKTTETTDVQSNETYNDDQTTNVLNNETGDNSNQTGIVSSQNEEEILDEHTHGNVGVTTNQQMINSELELREFDIYQNISRRFALQFVYLNS